MKFFILLSSFVLLSYFSYSQKTEEIQWYSFEEALALNKENPKLIFIDVYTEWCGWCKKMDATTFKEASIAQYMNKKYYCVKLDAEGDEAVTYYGKTYYNPNPDGRRSTHQIAALLLRNKMSYPSYVFLNEESKILTVVNGFITAEKFDPIIHWFGERVYLKQTYQEYIKTYSLKE